MRDRERDIFPEIFNAIFYSWKSLFYLQNVFVRFHYFLPVCRHKINAPKYAFPVLI